MEAASVILRLLDLLVAGSIAYEQLAVLQARLRAMQAEGRDPTPAEWASLFDGIEADSARLDRVARNFAGAANDPPAG